MNILIFLFILGIKLFVAFVVFAIVLNILTWLFDAITAPEVKKNDDETL